MGQVVRLGLPLDGVRVLLVEDHPEVREVLGRLLVAFGAAVTVSAGVAEALEAFERERPDVVLSDIEMADENGYALIRKVRAMPRERGGADPGGGPDRIEHNGGPSPGTAGGFSALRGEAG